MAQRKKTSGRRKRRSMPIYPRTLILALIGLCFLGLLLKSGPFSPTSQTPPHEPQAYFETMAPLAQKMQQRYGVRASVMLAQSALESDYGRSELAANYNNYFGIKGNGDSTDVRFLTQEVYNGQEQTVEDAFRSYRSIEASFKDYAKLLTSYDRYAPVIAAQTYQEAAYALQSAGYATDLQYPQKIIHLIEHYQLYTYDAI